MKVVYQVVSSKGKVVTSFLTHEEATNYLMTIKAKGYRVEGPVFEEE